ncbi:glycosyltransferase [Ramlibacter sp. WS9]|uniref:glycosyltransferase n=1 Tax=Ramlibacter sp. WS9 TaxID=1882741 RepID=UPI0011435F38|nr:glycosyltransferase [Ramlibacter sp. WS9]ROZ66358.1 glycosyltransferase [Ramlibacter sp. WS9]
MNGPRRALFVQYTNPGGYPPLQHIADILLADGWELTFLGVSGGGAERLELHQHRRQTVLNMKSCSPGWRQKLHYAAYALWVLWWRLRWRPQCIYASDTLSAPAALLASTWPVSALVYHEHDAPPPPAGRFQSWLHACRARLARKASAVVVPNAVRGQFLVDETRIAPNTLFCVWNCPAREEAVGKAPERDNRALWLIYHGSIVQARLPLTVLDAMATLPAGIKLRVIGYETAGSQGYTELLRDRAQALGLGGRVEFEGVVTRESLLSHASNAHVGLALMPMHSTDLNMKHMTGASNKPFEYLARGCGLIVSDLPDWDELFVKSGLGVKCDPESAQSIAAAIAWYWDRRDDMAAIGERGRQAILNGYNYEQAFSAVKHQIDARCSPRVISNAGAAP